MTNEEIFEKIKANISNSEYKRYRKNINYSEKLSSKSKYVFLVPNILILKWIKNKYLSLMTESFSTSEKKVEIKIILEKDVDMNSFKIKTKNKEEQKQKHINTSLNPSFKFDNFIVGASNQFAFTTSKEVSLNPGKSFNPLVIYGDVGLGKTHLLQAIGNELSHKNIICINAEQFVNEFTSAILNKTNNNQNMVLFKKKYRNCDVLLIDDIQFIGNKIKVQEEFFYTFNELHSKSAQIVLISDKKPRDIKGLEERLRSRFEMGITTNIKHPEIETKVEIIKKKCELDSIAISDEIIFYIANNLNSSIREIEGVLLKLNAYANMLNQDITIELTKNVLKDHILKSKNKITPEFILNIASKSLNIKPSEIKSKSKNKLISEARRIVIYLIRELTDESMAKVASFFLMKDHSSVSHASRRIKKDINGDSSYLNKIEKIKNLIIK